MHSDYEMMEQTKSIFDKFAQGVNPLTGETLEKGSLLTDAQLVRFFHYASEIMNRTLTGRNGHNRKPQLKFLITPEQKQKIQFPQGKIGVNEFSRCVNLWIDPTVCRPLTGAELNKQLRKLNILGETKTEAGKTKTTVNPDSYKFGFETEKRTYHGADYEMVLINDYGKKYLVENLECIMGKD